MRVFIAILALAMLGSASPVARASSADSCGYAYGDDFSANAVESDSYSHTTIEGSFCLACLNGWLMFATDSTGNRGLGFYPGQMYGSRNAYVTYRFPQDGIAGGMTGSLAFDALSYAGLAGSGGFAWADVIVSYDDVYAATAHISQPGHYTFELAPPLTASKVYFYITGQLFRLDNLSVCLDAAVPTLTTSWGRIKSIYR